MSIFPKTVASRAVTVIVVLAMLLAAYAILLPWGGNASATATINHIPGAQSSFAGPDALCGQVPVPLASAASYAVLASSTITSTGATALTGNLGLSPGTSVTGFPPGTITGIKNVTTPSAAHAEANLTIAYNNATGRTNCPVSVAGNIGGQTLTPGLYKSTSSLAISSGDLTLSGGGNPNGVFVFQVASTLTTTSGRTVILTDGAQAGNVFWEVGSSATLGTTSTMQGTVMARDSISMLTGSTLDGRAMAETGEVSLAGATITVPATASLSTYPLTFTESGLAAATSWSVTSGGVLSSATTSTIVFNVVSGTYAFTVGVVGYIADPASGHVTVDGAAASQTISFTGAAAGSFSIMFTESGLPSGTSWFVTSGGVLNTSAGATLGFVAASGTYAFTVGLVSNYSATPSTGSVTINGASGSQAIAFVSVGGSGTGGGNGTTAPSGPLGISSSDWDIIAIVVAVAVVAGIVGVALAMRRK
jgi:hypothetical protein